VDDLELELDLPTGALIFGDAAAVFADARPLVDGLPVGTFPARVAGGALEVRLSAAEPAMWAEVSRLDVPSGYAALLDAAALAAYTDLGDEPVDEFELLAERFGSEGENDENSAARFQDVLALRGAGAAAVLKVGRDAKGAPCRIVIEFEG
jgi:hypothetical protein